MRHTLKVGSIELFDAKGHAEAVEVIAKFGYGENPTMRMAADRTLTVATVLDADDVIPIPKQLDPAKLQPSDTLGGRLVITADPMILRRAVDWPPLASLLDRATHVRIRPGFTCEKAPVAGECRVRWVSQPCTTTDWRRVNWNETLSIYLADLHQTLHSNSEIAEGARSLLNGFVRARWIDGTLPDTIAWQPNHRRYCYKDKTQHFSLTEHLEANTDSNAGRIELHNLNDSNELPIATIRASEAGDNTPIIRCVVAHLLEYGFVFDDIV